MSKKPDTPNISAELIDEGSQQLFNESVKECLEVLEGKRGDGLDRALTARDLSTAGVIKVTTSSSEVAGEIAIAVTPVVTDVVEFPITPTGLTVSGAFTNILLVWDSPTFEGFTSTEVWRYETNLLASSVLVATVEHHMYSEPVNPASTYYYWIRHVNKLNQKGSFNASSGTLGQTNQTVASILTDLNESIGLSSLDTALSADIATIGTIGTSVTAHTSALGAIEGEQYIRINGASEVAGYGIAAGATSSEFTVNAGLFKVGNGVGGSTIPFFIVSGQGMTVAANGTKYTNTPQSYQLASHPLGKWFAAGTYMDTAMIADASIDTAKINNLTVDIANVTGILTVGGKIDATLVEADSITSDKITMDGNIEFSNTQSGVQFGKDSLGSTAAGAFFGRSGGVAGFHISSATSGIYADSSGTVALNNVRLYTGAAGSAVEYPNPGQVTQALNISSLTPRLYLIIIGGGGGSCNAGVYNPPYGKLAGAAGGGSYVQWYSGLNGTGSIIQTTSAAGGAGVAAGSVGSNRSSASGVAGQASSKAAGGSGGSYAGGAGGHGSFGSGGGGPAGSDTINGSSNAPVNVSASAGVTFSQNVDVPTLNGNRAQSLKIFVGYGGAGGAGFTTFIGPNDNEQGANVAAGGNGGNGFVSVADPNSGGIEVDLLSILTRLTALEGA